MADETFGGTPIPIRYGLKITPPPSPRAPAELDVKNYLEKLQEDLRSAQTDLKDYKRVIETYRSEIGGMQ